jgi:hypothetical protein
VSAAATEPFEAFPREPLALRWRRRHLLSLLTDEARILLDPQRRGSACRLADLGTLPDEALELLKPGLAPACRLRREGDAVWADPGLGGPIRLFATTSPASGLLDRFDGRNRLGEIVAALADERGWPRERALAYARGVFLHLVSLGVCLPS